MTLATGLVLAITVGMLAQNSGSLMAFLSGEEVGVTKDDQFTIRAGKEQILDVLANDTIAGDITIVDQPACGSVRAIDGNVLEYGDSAECLGNLVFTYCVADEDTCLDTQVALNVVGGGQDVASLPVIESATEVAPVVENDTSVQPETATAPVLVQPVITVENDPVQEDVAVVAVNEDDDTNVVNPISDGPAPSVIIAAPAAFSYNDISGKSGLQFYQPVDVSGSTVVASSTDGQSPVDSSDIVVEMAAQILLPGARIGASLNENTQASPGGELMMTDGLFTADLEVSSPPEQIPDQVEVASLPATDVNDTTENPELVSQPATSSCEIVMDASARPGAAILLAVESACRAGQMMTVSHSGFSFTARTDENGSLSISIPAFTENAVVSLVFEDGSETQTEVLVRDAGDMERMAIVWSVPVDLDLHAFEDNAADGSEGHVWIENARKYRDTLTGGGGFLESFGDPEIIGGTMAEVYTLPTNRLRSQTIVSMDLRINDASGYCGEKAILRTVRTQDGGTTRREFNLLMPDCSSASAGMVLENFVDAISVARR